MNGEIFLSESVGQESFLPTEENGRRLPSVNSIDLSFWKKTLDYCIKSLYNGCY